MSNDETLRHLNSSWPETDNYLVQLGQLQNDLMVMRELQMDDQYTPTWLDLLAIDAEDLTQVPTAMSTLRFLDSRGITVPTASQVQAFQELATEQIELHRLGEEESPNLLDVQGLELHEADDQKLWELPELQQQILRWATTEVNRITQTEHQVTLAQATMFMMLSRFIDQESGMTPEWAAESARSLLSSEFYLQAGKHPQQTSTN